jgi:hypothetical protein
MSMPDAAALMPAASPNAISNFSRMHIGGLSDAESYACQISLIKSRIAHRRNTSRDRCPCGRRRSTFLTGERVFPSRTAKVLQSALALTCGGAA